MNDNAFRYHQFLLTPSEIYEPAHHQFLELEVERGLGLGYICILVGLSANLDVRKTIVNEASRTDGA